MFEKLKVTGAPTGWGLLLTNCAVGATLKAVRFGELAEPVPPSRSLTVTNARNTPSSSGVNVKKALAVSAGEDANEAPFLVTAQV